MRQVCFRRRRSVLKKVMWSVLNCLIRSCRKAEKRKYLLFLRIFSKKDSIYRQISALLIVSRTERGHGSTMNRGCSRRSMQYLRDVRDSGASMWRRQTRVKILIITTERTKAAARELRPVWLPEESTWRRAMLHQEMPRDTMLPVDPEEEGRGERAILKRKISTVLLSRGMIRISSMERVLTMSRSPWTRS